MQVLLPVPAAHQCRGWRATSGGRARGALAHRAPAHQRSDCWRRRGASALMDAQQQHQQQHEQEQLPSWLQDMDAAFLTSALGAPIVSFTISNARELEQSDCCVVHATDDAGRTTPLLLKRYNLPRLRKREQKPDSKWRISAASFANEHCFLSARGVLAELHAFLQPHAGVPRVHLAQRRHDSSSADVLDSKFDFLFELLEPERFSQSSQLDAREARAALTLLARFHAFFWQPGKGPAGGAASGQEDEERDAQWRGVFARGCWWRKALRPSVKYERIPEAFAGLCASFPDAALFGRLDTPANHQAMARLRDSVDVINGVLEQAPDRTLVHGDPKTSNLFFTRREEGTLSCYAIDYQWTGRAPSGMADVVYCVLGGVQHGALTGGGGSASVEELLQHYVAELHRALKERGVDDPERAASARWLQASWQLEVCAYWMTALPQLLDGLTPDVAAKSLGRYGWLTHEMVPESTSLLCEQALAAWAKVEAAGGPAELLAGASAPCAAAP